MSESHAPKKELQWETLACRGDSGKDQPDHEFPQVFRTPVYGGWLVFVKQSEYDMGSEKMKIASGLCFYPDPGHLWDGSSDQGDGWGLSPYHWGDD